MSVERLEDWERCDRCGCRLVLKQANYSEGDWWTTDLYQCERCGMEYYISMPASKHVGGGKSPQSVGSSA